MQTPMHVSGSGFGASNSGSGLFFPAWGHASTSGGWTGSENRTQTEMKRPGRFTGLQTWVKDNTGSIGTHRLALRVNGRFGNNVVWIGTGTGWHQDTSHTDRLAAGDKVNFNAQAQTYTTLSVGGAQGLWWDDTDTTQPMVNGIQDYNAFTADQFFPFVANGNVFVVAASEGTVAVNCAFAANILKCWVNCDANTRSGGTADIFKDRVNGVSGNIAVTITLGTTGEYEDITNSTSVAAGDKINGQFEAHATAGQCRVRCPTYNLQNSGNNFLWQGNREGANNDTDDFYIPVTGFTTRFYGSSQDGTVGEANQSHRAMLPFVWSKLWARHTGSGMGGITITSRRNGAAGAQTVTPSGSGDTQDVTNSDSVLIGDTICWKNARSGGTGGWCDGLSSMGYSASPPAFPYTMGYLRPNIIRPYRFAPGHAR